MRRSSWRASCTLSRMKCCRATSPTSTSRCVPPSDLLPLLTRTDRHAPTRVIQLFPIRYQDHLLYHYLGGTILALLGDYTRAASLLETVRLEQF